MDIEKWTTLQIVSIFELLPDKEHRFHWTEVFSFTPSGIVYVVRYDLRFETRLWMSAKVNTNA